MKIVVTAPFVYGDKTYRKGEIAELPAEVFSADRMEMVVEATPTKEKKAGGTSGRKNKA